MNNLNKNNPAYQIGYEQGFKDGVLKERSQNPILDEIREMEILVQGEPDENWVAFIESKIKSWQKRLKEDAKCKKCGDRINAEEDSICGNCI